MNLPRLIASGGVLAGTGIGFYVLYRLLQDEAPGKNESASVPDVQPDVTPVAPTSFTPGSTGYKRVDAILPQIRAAVAGTNIPLGLAVGWIARESGGKLAVHPQPGLGDTGMDERGYWQLTPEESSALGLDHQRLSTDSDYSLNAGVLLAKKYAKAVDKLKMQSALQGSPFYWRMVKLIHTVGGGDTGKIVKAAQAADQANSWDELKAFALTGAAKTKHSPVKWFPLVDSVFSVGAPFGFGSEQTSVVGGSLHLLGCERA